MSNVHILLDISDIHHLHCDDLKNSERHDDACLVISQLHVCQVLWLQRTLESSGFVFSP